MLKNETDTQGYIMEINIKKADLIGELASALDHAGSTDWDVYVNAEGNVDTRHNTYDNSDWVEIIDLYYTAYDCDDGCDNEELAAWIVEDVFDPLSEKYEVWCDDLAAFVEAEIYLVE